MIHTFLTTLFGTTTEPKVIWTRGPWNESHFERDVANMPRHVEACAQDRDVYVGMYLLASLPTGPAARGKFENVGGLVAFYMDVDYLSDSHKGKGYPPSRDSALALVREALPAHKPSMVVNTGNGVHCYWLLKSPWRFPDDADEKARAQKYLQDLQYTVREKARERGFTFDSTFDITRVLRVPGTLNHRNPQNPKPVTLLYCDDACRYAPEDFDGYLLESPSAQGRAIKDLDAFADVVVPDTPPYPSIALLELMSQNERVRKSVEGAYRRDLRDNTGSGHDMSLADAMLFRGWTPQDTVNDLVACLAYRRDAKVKPRSYYLYTLAAASAFVDEKREEQARVPDRDAAVKLIKAKTGLSVEALLQTGQDKPYYVLLLTDGSAIKMPSSAYIMARDKFVTRIAEYTGHVLSISKLDWPEVCKALLATRELLTEHDMRMTTAEWLDSYMEGSPPFTEESTQAQALKEGRPFAKDGLLYVSLHSFCMFVNTRLGLQLGDQEMMLHLQSLGFRATIKSYRDKEAPSGVRSVSYWVGPKP